MPHLFEHLALLAAFVALMALTIDADDELTEPQARVLCAAMKVIEHVTIVYGTVLAAQDAPLALVVKAVTTLLR
ncbi:hypothetical protein ACWCQ0_41470 [Streptomyces massasporeus]|uniref:Uncharacterized protein n=1 Tax=Streptomyces massasporeus TaxID=67324 RepID=A0ABW6LUQ3_9ACTN